MRKGVVVTAGRNFTRGGSQECQILQLGNWEIWPVLVLYRKLLCPAELCARHAGRTEPQHGECTRNSALGDTLLLPEAETSWPVLFCGTWKKLSLPAQLRQTS